MMGGFNVMPLLFWGIFAVIMVQVVQGVLNRGDEGYLEDGSYYGKLLPWYHICLEDCA